MKQDTKIIVNSVLQDCFHDVNNSLTVLLAESEELDDGEPKSALISEIELLARAVEDYRDLCSVLLKSESQELLFSDFLSKFVSHNYKQGAVELQIEFETLMLPLDIAMFLLKFMKKNYFQDGGRICVYEKSHNVFVDFFPHLDSEFSSSQKKLFQFHASLIKKMLSCFSGSFSLQEQEDICLQFVFKVHK